MSPGKRVEIRMRKQGWFQVAVVVERAMGKALHFKEAIVVLGGSFGVRYSDR